MYAPNFVSPYLGFQLIICSAATVIAILLSFVNPDFHTFCVLDMNISYPYRPAKISLWLFILLSIIFPILTIITICFSTPFRICNSTRDIRTLSQKLEYLNASLLGLGVSLGTSTVIFSGVKNLTGKPRPDFLSICNPDINSVGKYTVGGFGADFNRLWVMVSVDICRQSDKGMLKDAFRSFPSGYSTSEFHFEMRTSCGIVLMSYK